MQRQSAQISGENEKAEGKTKKMGQQVKKNPAQVE